CRLLALEPEWIDRVHDVNAALIRHLGQQANAAIEVGADFADDRAEIERLSLLAAAGLSGGHQDQALQAGARAIPAIEAEVLPVEAQATIFAPSACACDTATVMPPSLKDPVGFMPRCFACRFSSPAHAAHRGAL